MELMESKFKDIDFKYLFSLEDKKNLELYFKMKNKHNLFLTEEEKTIFVKKIVACLKKIKFEYLVVPQSSNLILKEIATILDPKFITIQKKDITKIIEYVESMKLQKAQKQKLMNDLKNNQKVNNEIRMASLAGNQREIIAEFLFEKLEFPNDVRVLCLDDSVFSGYSLYAANTSIVSKDKEFICLFSQL